MYLLHTYSKMWDKYSHCSQVNQMKYKQESTLKLALTNPVKPAKKYTLYTDRLQCLRDIALQGLYLCSTQFTESFPIHV